jgi:hypothetical protein
MKLSEVVNGIFGGTKAGEYFLESVDLISPYLSNSFFCDLSKLKPKAVYVVTDAGTSSDLVAEVEAVKKANIEQVFLAKSDGIVHAKVYFFRWKNKSTGKYKKVLLWGSCNASEGGFGRNTEVYSWLRLGATDKKLLEKVESYFFELRELNTKKYVDSVVLEEVKGLSVILPEIVSFNKEEESLELWIQKGRLCHEFPVDPSFRHLKITLLKKIVPDEGLKSAFSGSAIELKQQASISIDYLRGGADRSAKEFVDKESKKWKSGYFIDTSYGFWTSSESFSNNSKDFTKSDKKKRAFEIKKISEASKDDMDEWCNNFISEVEKICMNGGLAKPSEYFKFRNGHIDRNHYFQILKNQLKRDCAYAKNDWFRNGYISGFVFPEVPPIRDSELHWKDFLDSWYGALNFQLSKPNTRSHLARTIRDFAEIDVIDPENFNQKWMEKRDIIVNFWNFEYEWDKV